MRAQLVAALEESLQATPDPAEVLLGVRHGIERRRRQRRYLGSGAALVIFALVVVAGVVTWPAGPSPGAKVIPVGDWPGTVELTWVPAGMTLSNIRNTLAGEEIWYGSYEPRGQGVTAPTAALRVFVDNVDQARNLDEPGWQRTEINGRPAREISRDVRTMITLQLPSGRWTEIQLQRLPYERNHQPPRIGFAPTYLPAGQRIIGLATGPQRPDGEGEIVCAAGSLQPGEPKEYLTEGGIVDHRRPADLGPGLRISFHRRDVRPEGAERIDDIQGRPAYLYPQSRTRLMVSDFHGGLLVVEALLDGESFVMARPDELPPVTEMIKVAQAVRWIG